jgi:hypothetical protein
MLKYEEIEVPSEEMELLWHLACALLPACDFNFQSAFAAAIRKRTALMNEARENGIPLDDDGFQSLHKRRGPGGFYVRQRVG